MAISNDLLSSTLYSIRDGEVDELFQKVAFLDHAKRYNGIEYEDGGIKIQRPLSIAEHSQITNLPTGYEAVNLAVKDVLQPAIYEWADFAAPIVITKKEELENKGEKAIVKIVEARMRSVMGMLRRELNKQILAGSSTVLTTVNTLNGDVAGGFLEAETKANQNNTVGGISKTTYPVNGWLNQVADIQGAFGTNGILGMQQMAIQANTVTHMGEIQCVLLSEAAMANYRRAMFQQERYINETTLDGGRMQLAFGGAVCEQDLELGFSYNSADFGNAPLSGYFLNFDGVKLCMHRDADFAVSPFEHISGTTARAAQLYVKMQLIADHLGSCGVLFDADTF
mgnify:FL=1|tara:strand:+ start:1275 stop:2291 length:1017 start_codon:yes stop_codon:yes gene_type:complete